MIKSEFEVGLSAEDFNVAGECRRTLHFL